MAWLILPDLSTNEVVSLTLMLTTGILDVLHLSSRSLYHIIMGGLLLQSHFVEVIDLSLKLFLDSSELLRMFDISEALQLVGNTFISSHQFINVSLHITLDIS